MAIIWDAAQLPVVVERLANGLTLIVHVEPKSPIAAVYVGYRAGSRYEPKSKAGLAHLSEHLMFSGTKNNPGSYFASFEQAGAMWMNAFVREDYSAYFATVPNAALDFAMSMEADRMANLIDVLQDARVERQREVVVNEIYQRESQPYGCASRILAELAHPAGHPYGHPPDGLVAELRDISADDVRGWIGSRHVPEMATLIVAGDVDPADVISKAQRHFGLLAGSPAPRPASFPAYSAVASRRQIEMPVRNSRLCIAWSGPIYDCPDYPALEFACEILGGGKGSRLGRRIIQSEHLASDVSVEMRPRELAAQATVSVTALRGVPLNEIERRIRREIERLSAEGPEPSELEVARLRLFGKMVRGFERVGGPQSKSDALGLATMVGAAPASHDRRLSMLATMRSDLVARASHWLAGTGAVLEMRPITERNGI